MYGMVKTHKADNPVRVITKGCNTVVEKLIVIVLLMLIVRNVLLML